MIRNTVEAESRSFRRRSAIAITKQAVRVMARGQNVCGWPHGIVHGAGVRGGADAGRELTWTVSVSDKLPFAGNVGAAGSKMQVEPLGTFKHWKVTVPVAPFCELSVILKLADCPTESVAELGETVPLKSAPCT